MNSDGIDLNIPKFAFYYSEATLLHLLNVDDTKRKEMADFFTRPIVRPPKEGGANYRFINYLSNTGLLDDNRDKAGKGWRKFSFVEMVYINLVIVLRNFGLKADTIKPLHGFFSEKYDPVDKNYTCNGLRWLNALIAIHFGYEIEILIFSDDRIMILDPQMMNVFGKRTSEGVLRVSLSVMVNKTRETFGMKKLDITGSFDKSILSSAEVDILLGIRNLEEGQERIKIKRTKGGILIEQDKIINAGDGDFAHKITELMEDDFVDIQAVKRNGKVVNVKQTKSKLFKN